MSTAGILDVGLTLPSNVSGVTDPFDPANVQELAATAAYPSQTISLLPREFRHQYATFDCSKRIKLCKLGNNHDCSACRSLGGGECIVPSAGLDISDDEPINGMGVCVPRDEAMDYATGRLSINPRTTVVAAALVSLPNGKGNVLAKSTDCVDSSLVRKNPASLSEYPLEAPVMNCDDIVACGGKGVGYPVHPRTGRAITVVDDIDFDLNQLASIHASCLCEPGYVQSRDVSGRPSCVVSEGGVLEKNSDWGCPVIFDTGESSGCLCDPATQLRLADVLSEVPGIYGTDYGVQFIDAAKGLLKALRQARRSILDACIPRPGVDDRVAAMGYAYAPHLFGESEELTCFNGGHLMSGGIVRRGAVTRDGEWSSRIESAEIGRVVMSDSLGGVTPYMGTGAVAAHEWGGHSLNDNNLTGPGGEPNFTVHPNAVLRVVPPPRSGIPGWGADSMDHAVGLIASQGRVYPMGVHGRVNYDSNRTSGAAHPRGATLRTDSTYLGLEDADPEKLAEESPLGRARAAHDSGICATAFIVPTAQPSSNGDDPMLPLIHVRPMARALGFTPLVRVFKVACAGVGVAKLFPSLHGDETGLDVEEVERRLESIGSDGLGALLVQPTTISGGGKSSLFARFGEEMLAANSPKIIDHYAVGPSERNQRVSWDEQEAKRCFALPPTAGRIVSNETGFFSGRGLPSGVPGTGFMNSAGGTVDFFASAVLSADSVLMNGFTSISRPQTLPVSTPPEWVWHEPRSPARANARASSVSVLSAIRNKYADITSNRLIGHLTVDKDNFRNTYNPPKPSFWRRDRHGEKVISKVLTDLSIVYPLLNTIPLALMATDHSVGPAHAVVPVKFHAADERWRQGTVKTGELPRIIPPSMALLESSFRVRTLASEGFVRPEVVPPYQRADWATNTHTAGHYLSGLFSPLSIAEETGQTDRYPCTGALPQYITMLVPRARGPGSHLTSSEHAIRQALESRSPLDSLSNLAKKENCNCTSDIFCTRTNSDQTHFGKTVAAVPSRGNRHAPFLLNSSLPKNDPEHVSAVLMAQAGDVGILKEVGRRGRVNAPLGSTVRKGWHKNTKFPLAANRWQAMRTNIAWTPYSTRPEVEARSNLVERSMDVDRTNTRTMGGGRLDLPNIDQLERNESRYSNESPDFVDRAKLPGLAGAIGRRQLDFFESSNGVVPSTMAVGTFSPWAEGSGDVVAIYGTPLFSRPKLTAAAAAAEGNVERRKRTRNKRSADGAPIDPHPLNESANNNNNIPRAMRKIHTMIVNAPTMNGYASGQTAAEAALTRGRELWYASYVKPAVNPAATTSMEGIRAKAAEPFDDLALRDFATLDRATLAKFCHHHHYGLDGLVSLHYAEPVRVSQFPFSCQSDRRPFPPTRRGRIQPSALVEMGAIDNKHFSLV